MCIREKKLSINPNALSQEETLDQSKRSLIAQRNKEMQKNLPADLNRKTILESDMYSKEIWLIKESDIIPFINFESSKSQSDISIYRIEISVKPQLTRNQRTFFNPDH